MTQMTGLFRRILLILSAFACASTLTRADLVREREPNGSFMTPQPIVLPLTVGGRIDPAGDVDLYAFRGEAGQVVVADVLARGFRAGSNPGSSLTALLEVYDESGALLAQDQSMGPFDDPTVSVTLPAGGIYYLS